MDERQVLEEKTTRQSCLPSVEHPPSLVEREGRRSALIRGKLAPRRSGRRSKTPDGLTVAQLADRGPRDELSHAWPPPAEFPSISSALCSSAAPPSLPPCDPFPPHRCLPSAISLFYNCLVHNRSVSRCASPSLHRMHSRRDGLQFCITSHLEGNLPRVNSARREGQNTFALCVGLSLT